MDTSPGAGFLPDVSPGVQNSQTKGGDRNQNRVLIPCTLRQLNDAQYQEHDVMIDGVGAKEVSVCGLIVQRTNNNQNVNITLDDGTSTFEVRYFVHQNDEAYINEVKESWVEGRYVTVSGTPRDFKGSKYIMAINIRAVSDHNEVTYHGLNAIRAHLHNKKLSKNAAAAAAAGEANFGQYGSSVPGGNTFVGASGGSTFAGAEVSDLEDQVVKKIHELDTAESESGPSFNAIKDAFSGSLSDAQIRTALDGLVGNGHVYTTLDSDHFKSTMFV
eukprot:GFYU01002656.1.p1 GENE.GFYU01002656.1~~GFYU01002656.1.p1  ORF type:complete len:296 (-),score=73.01 GFYU01002656.1:56-874(-)